jgi:hypothetical protein
MRQSRSVVEAATELPAVEGVLNYLAPTAEKPVNYTFQPPRGVAWRSGTPEPHAVAIRDARALARRPSLDVEGFALLDQATGTRDFQDEEARSAYEREVEALLKGVSGAERVVVFDHTLRSVSAETRDKIGARPPVLYVHNDYTTVSGRRRVTDLLDPEEAAERLRGRHAVVNVWRPIGAPVEELPLAVCDARSIAADDWVPTDLVYPDRVGEVYSVRYNPAHRWYYYPAMRPDEALLIKTYDSAEDGRARFSAHSAFVDPTSSPDARPRQSIEVRALVFF